MNVDEYLAIRTAVLTAGYGDDIEWSEMVKPPKDAKSFAREFIFVVCNSGMKFTVAVPIFKRIWATLETARTESRTIIKELLSREFGHEGKVGAIVHVWRNRQLYFDNFKAAPDKVAYCETLPWIGPITKYHLAKNLGVDCAKPDRHLERIARAHGKTVDQLCNDLAQKSGDRIATVDVVLWRASAIGIINTKEL